MRADPVEVLETGMDGLRKWLSEPYEYWSFPSSRRGPGSPKCGCASRKLKLAQGVRGETRTTCRLLAVGNAESVWMIRAFYG